MKESRLPASLTPHPAVVLAIDPGASSGWAVFDAGRYVTSGVAKRAIGRSVACDMARDQARASGLRLIVVAEKWTPGGKFAGARTMAGLGTSWGEWLAAIETAEIPKSRIVRVFTQTWRAAVLSPPRGMKSEALKALAVYRAQAITGMPNVNHDESDAICIGLWATRSAAVAKKAPKARTKRARAA